MTESTNIIGLVERLDLAALKKLCEEATPGPWVTDDPNRELVAVIGAGGAYEYLSYCRSNPDLGWEQDCANAAFIAASREALPKLIDALEAALRIMKPFALYAEVLDLGGSHEESVLIGFGSGSPSMADLRAARRFTQGDYR